MGRPEPNKMIVHCSLHIAYLDLRETMAFKICIVTIILFVTIKVQMCLSEISKDSFPKGFVFGTASSAFQVCKNFLQRLQYLHI
jgi:hypothetical protein